MVYVINILPYWHRELTTVVYQGGQKKPFDNKNPIWEKIVGNLGRAIIDNLPPDLGMIPLIIYVNIFLAVQTDDQTPMHKDQSSLR